MLKIIAMLMIISFHIVIHTVTVQFKDPASMGREIVDFFNHPVFYSRLLLIDGILTFGKIGNALFMQISGFFMANRKPEEIKLFSISQKLLLQLGFAAVTLVCLSPVLHYIKPDWFVYMPGITFFNSMSWYVGYYFVVILCGKLFLNRFLETLDEKQYSTFLIALFAFVQFGWSGGLAEALMKGLRRVLIGIFLYALGGFIKKYNPLNKVRGYVFVLLLLFVYLLVGISSYNVTGTNIETYIRKETTTPFIQSFTGYDDFSIVVVLIGVCLFELFQRIRLPENRIIAFLGQSTFMIYLLHDNKLFYEIWNLRDWVTTMAKSPFSFVSNLFKWTMYTFVFGLLVYLCYLCFMAIVKKSKRILLK